jgi:hypothetical protein
VSWASPSQTKEETELLKGGVPQIRGGGGQGKGVAPNLSPQGTDRAGRVFLVELSASSSPHQEVRAVSAAC